MLEWSAAGLDRLLADGKLRAGNVSKRTRADSAQIASTIDSAENEKTYENRSTVKRHGSR